MKGQKFTTTKQEYIKNKGKSHKQLIREIQIVTQFISKNKDVLTQEYIKYLRRLSINKLNKTLVYLKYQLSKKGEVKDVKTETK